MKLFFSKNIKIKAFTLLETLTSIVIITTVILGPLTFTINSSGYARQTKDVMTLTYLAEESLELLHNQYDSIYLACLNGVYPCDPSIPLANETPGETAWRIFRNRLIDPMDSSNCTVAGGGCVYDFIDMAYSTTTPPTKRIVSDPLCSTLELRTSARLSTSALYDNARKYFVCKGKATGTYGTLFSKTSYSRKVMIESVPTFDGTYPNPGSYNDDLRIKVRASFRRANGTMRDIDVVDFLHARP